MPQNSRRSPKRPGTVTIGVTGHRFLQGIDTLVVAIDGVLEQITIQWSGLPMTVISALAEGSDRLVAQRVLGRPGAKLVVPLPMPEEEYARDFKMAGSQREFHDLLAQADRVVRFPPAPARPLAYAASGEYMVGECDVLIAIWNGLPPQGDGGTGAVVELARQWQCPLIWIHANDYRPGYPAQPDEVAQGSITFENF
jgi:hypothetical protein